MAQGVGAAEELLEGWWGLPALPVETPGVSGGGVCYGHGLLIPPRPTAPTCGSSCFEPG